MHWAVYCRVIDNFGDIGFAWRLAADLAQRGETVRLVVDDASALRWLAPAGHPGVSVARWDETTGGSAGDHGCPDVAVDTFGCGLPAGLATAWRNVPRPPLRIDVEHLSAERYVERSHGLASPPTEPPGIGPTWYFYPGFTARTGGLIREGGVTAPAADMGGHGHDEPRRVFAFCYDSTAFTPLLDVLASAPTTLLCAPGAATVQARGWQALRQAGMGGLHIVEAPHVAQPAFDDALRASDLNIVRGEDSLVRAIWAARPFIWHIYSQDDGAHAAKLEAFLDLFLAQASAGLAKPLRNLFRRWNDLPAPPLQLPDLLPWRAHCERFASDLARQRDLTSQLIDFARAKR